MRHLKSSDFRKLFDTLPAEVQAQARKQFELVKINPRHPSLRFKKVGDIWSVRVSTNYRALAEPVDGGFYWYWIGSHAEYNRLIRG